MAQATVYIDTNRVISAISPLLFSGFAEHMGRCIYEGIYDPASPHADDHGLRRDVLAALRDLNLCSVRYPGGNFLSGYYWEDGIGPKDQRPRRRDLAWQSIETNQFGTDEFLHFCRELNTEPMLGVNMGTGTIQDAANLVEYCNGPVGTRYGDLRAQNGAGINSSTGGSVIVLDSILRQNTATSSGGGIVNTNGSNLTVENTTITNNQAPTSGDSGGGGIHSVGATMTVRNSTISNNVGNVGAGMTCLNSGSLYLFNSTISGNSGGYGAGIDLDRTTVWIVNSTIVNNSGTVSGSGIRDRGTVIVKNSIVANNTGQPNCSASLDSVQGANFSTDTSCGLTQVTAGDLNLQQLADNGGPTQTHAPGAGSVAIDAAADCTTEDGVTPVLVDQRGVGRPQGAACEVGAYEYP